MGGIPVRMLQINPQQANAFDVNVILRKALFANVLHKRRKIYAVPTSILNIGYASNSRGNVMPKKALGPVHTRGSIR